MLTLRASPDPVVGDLCGSHCGDLAGEREALTELTIRETAGVGANLTGGSQELRNAATGAVVATSTFSASDFIRDAGTTRGPDDRLAKLAGAYLRGERPPTHTPGLIKLRSTS
jgi:hypothetical protein